MPSYTRVTHTDGSHSVLKVYDAPSNPPLVIANCGTGSTASSFAQQIAAAMNAAEGA